MNAQEIRMYKIKNVQKISRNGENIENTEKNKVLPKRYMQDVSALFANKTPADSILEEINSEEIEVVAIEEVKQEENIFFTSLKEMKPKDIVLNEVAKNVKKPSFDFIRYFVLLVSMAIFVVAGYKIVEQLYSYVEAARANEALRRLFYDDEEDFQEAQFLKKTKKNPPIQDILALQKQTGEKFIEAVVSDGVVDVDKKRQNMRKLSDINSDLYCWIKVNFTTIDYPVVQTTDNEYYLHYNFEKKWNPSGAIFVDSNNSRDIAENRNLVIYGHNMLDNSMFQPLIDFSKRYDFFQNGIIELITEDAMYYYEVFSANEEDPSSGYIRTQFEEDDEYVEFLLEMKERSIFQKNVVLNADSKIITLSTCVNDIRLDRRFVVRGVLIDVK